MHDTASEQPQSGFLPADMSGVPTPEIPGYTIRSVIGTGGFATVYLAQQHTLQRDVALKVMKPELLADEEFRARFLREAQDTASLGNHPNIITIHDVGHANQAYYIAMQYLPGPNLKQQIEAAEVSPDTDQLLITLASALSYVHQKGFVHRDIKPANILFTEAGEAVLSDFGVARLGNRHTQLTQCGTIVGTARYMSPEQSRGDPHSDARSDLYSLGVVMYEVLAHHPPFEAADPLALMFMHLNEPIPRLSKNHARYQPILDKLMAKQLNDRYQSASALLHDLQSGMKLGISATNRQLQATRDDSANRQPFKETQTSAVLAAALSVLALLAGSLVFLYTKTDRPLVYAGKGCQKLTQSQEQERDSLMQLASIHREVGRLAHPPGANALDAYTLALDIDPCNRHIQDSMKQIRLATTDSP